MIPVPTNLISFGSSIGDNIQTHINNENGLAAIDLKADCGTPAVAAGDGIVHLPGTP